MNEIDVVNSALEDECFCSKKVRNSSLQVLKDGMDDKICHMWLRKSAILIIEVWKKEKARYDQQFYVLYIYNNEKKIVFTLN